MFGGWDKCLSWVMVSMEGYSISVMVPKKSAQEDDWYAERHPFGTYSVLPSLEPSKDEFVEDGLIVGGVVP